MFRSMLPRTSPRAGLRAAAPQSAQSTFAVPSMTFLRTSRRGYAAEAGMLCSLEVVGVRAWDPVERSMGSYGEEHLS